MSLNKKPKSLERKFSIAGWNFVAPAAILIFVLSFYPMIQSFILSLQSGLGNNLRFSGIRNYMRLFQDEKFLAALKNVFIYFIFQVPIMLFLALILASILNDPKLKFKGLFRTLVFLPCATSLVSSALIFKSLFSLDGLVNAIFLKWGVIESAFNWLGPATTPYSSWQAFRTLTIRFMKLPALMVQTLSSLSLQLHFLH